MPWSFPLAWLAAKLHRNEHGQGTVECVEVAGGMATLLAETRIFKTGSRIYQALAL